MVFIIIAYKKRKINAAGDVKREEYDVILFLPV